MDTEGRCLGQRSTRSRDWIYDSGCQHGYRGLCGAIMIVLPIPLLILAEQIWTKRKDWLLEPKEMAEDGLWPACFGFLCTVITTKLRSRKGSKQFAT